MSSSTYEPRMPASTTVDTMTAVGGGAHIHRRISWAAIFGGVILAVAIQLLLSLLGAGVGLGTVNTNAGVRRMPGPWGSAQVFGGLLAAALLLA